MSKQTNQEQSQDTSNFGKTNILEWTVFGFGLILILGVLVYLIYKMNTHNPEPADIHIEFIHYPSPNNPYKYRLKVQNTGGKTAKNVRVQLSLIKADTVLESSEIDFDYVPYSSKRIGWVVFSMPPSKADSIVSKVVSFNKAP